MSTETFGRPESPAAQLGATGQRTGVRSNTKAAWGLGLGVVGLATAFFVFPPIVFSTLAIILGAMGRSEARQDPARGGETMGNVAIALGVLGFVVAVAWTIVANAAL
jgi:hypothetical protein